MTAGRVAVAAAVAAVVFWGLKALVIWIAGGLDRSTLESPLFALGLLALLVTFAAVGVHLAGSRPLWQRVVAGVVAPVIGFVVTFPVGVGVAALVPDSAGWVQEEASLWVASVSTLILVFMFIRPRLQGRP